MNWVRIVHQISCELGSRVNGDVKGWSIHSSINFLQKNWFQKPTSTNPQLPQQKKPIWKDMKNCQTHPPKKRTICLKTISKNTTSSPNLVLLKGHMRHLRRFSLHPFGSETARCFNQLPSLLGFGLAGNVSIFFCGTLATFIHFQGSHRNHVEQYDDF